MTEQTTNNGHEPSDIERKETSPREWTSSQILDGHSEAIIVHAGELYRLRRTRNNKLILTK